MWLVHLNKLRQYLNLYKSVVKKVYKSSSIKSAETAKLLENTQRDLNIAFINEIAIACDKLKLSFSEVFKLALQSGIL